MATNRFRDGTSFCCEEFSERQYARFEQLDRAAGRNRWKVMVRGEVVGGITAPHTNAAQKLAEDTWGKDAVAFGRWDFPTRPF